MPTELILGHSPPVYSPLLYSSLMVTTSNRSVPPRIRPCLSVGSLNLDGLLKNTNDVINKRKKRVVFADDRGRPLTEVRVMKEPSNVPPLWTNTFVEKVLQCKLQFSKKLLSTNDQYPWELCFSQPASDYLMYRRKLDQDAVSLENVIIREADQCLMGTVKVKNLSYDKEVVIRVSTDSWTTHEDVQCSYVDQPAHQQMLTNLYDTFRFSLTLPAKSNVIEFCVRYRTNGSEFWDNNATKNYIVKKKQVVLQNRDELNKSDETLMKEIHNHTNVIEDALRVNIPTWSEFASWQHLSNDAPYW